MYSRHYVLHGKHYMLSNMCAVTYGMLCIAVGYVTVCLDSLCEEV